MKPVCELMTLEVFPGVRAILARKLVEKHGFSQKITAEKLGTTQPAVSQYKRELRGSRIQFLEQNPHIMSMIDAISDRTARGELTPAEISEEFCKICKFMRENDLISVYQN